MAIIGKGWIPSIGEYKTVFKDKKTGRLYTKFGASLYGGSGKRWVAKTSGIRIIKATKSRRAQRVPVYRTLGHTYNDPKEEARTRAWQDRYERESTLMHRGQKYARVPHGVHDSKSWLQKKQRKLQRQGFRTRLVRVTVSTGSYWVLYKGPRR